MIKLPHVLVLAYVYPPDAGSGTFRPLFFMNYLAQQGFRISVFTAKREDFHPDANVDEELIQTIHSSIEVTRCSVKRPLLLLQKVKEKLVPGTATVEAKVVGWGKPSTARKSTVAGAVKEAVLGLLACPDQHVGWVPDVLVKGLNLVRQEKVDCIYATGGPWSCLVAGALLGKIAGIPVVIDFRDPWVSNPNFTRKPSLLRYFETKMEAFVIRQAAVVVANTEELRLDFLSRYPQLHENSVQTITNGFESITRTESEINNRFSLVHAGELYMSRNPSHLLQAVANLIDEGEIDREHFRLKLIGGISNRDAQVDMLLHSSAIQEVVELVPRVSHKEAIAFQQQANALLLIQPDFPLQIPRKLFEYLSLCKPILAVTEPGSATGNIIRSNELGIVVENSTHAIKGAILQMYRGWRDGTLSVPNPSDLSAFRNDILAGRLGEIMMQNSLK